MPIPQLGTPRRATRAQTSPVRGGPCKSRGRQRPGDSRGPVAPGRSHTEPPPAPDRGGTVPPIGEKTHYLRRRRAEHSSGKSRLRSPQIVTPREAWPVAGTLPKISLPTALSWEES